MPKWWPTRKKETHIHEVAELMQGVRDARDKAETARAEMEVARARLEAVARRRELLGENLLPKRKGQA